MRVLIDCRWLGVGGIGRATELLLRGLAELRPVGTWVLWGPPAARALAWDGALYEPSGLSPRRLWGQSALLRVPMHDVAIYPGPIRPFRPGRSITVIHDTIPLRYGGNTGTRRLRRAYYRLVARLSSRILTDSEFSRGCLARDLGLRPDAVDVLRYPVDSAFVERVRVLRSRLTRSDTALYVGRFSRHKNLDRLIAAFARTRFAAAGGALLLVGGSPTEVAALRALVRASAVDRVTVEGVVPQARLEELYATARVLVMPSLEEGLGLPVWEAMTCGLTACVSDGGALPALTSGTAIPFPATSIAAMADAIDRSVATAAPPAPVSGPTLAEFAAQFVAALGKIGRRHG